jgi:membrane-associated phospholipid phosphatase
MIGAAAATVFAGLGLCAHHDLLDDVNHRVRRLLSRRGPRVVRRARALTLFSESGVHPLLAFVLSRATSRIVGVRTYAPLAASLASFVVNKGTRVVVDQPRPPGARPRRGLDRLGFPSGHTLAASAIAFTTALRIADERQTTNRADLLAAAAAYAGTIGWTRLVLDEHWLDDIVGALAGGIAIAILVHRADRATRPRPRRGPRIAR